MIQRFNLVFLLKPTACQFLFLQADKTEIFALERMVIVSLFFFFLYCLQERWQLTQKTQVWTGGMDKGEGEPGKLKSMRSSRGRRGDVGCKEHPGKGGQERTPWRGFG